MPHDSIHFNEGTPPLNDATSGLILVQTLVPIQDDLYLLAIRLNRVGLDFSPQLQNARSLHPDTPTAHRQFLQSEAFDQKRLNSLVTWAEVDFADTNEPNGAITIWEQAAPNGGGGGGDDGLEPTMKPPGSPKKRSEDSEPEKKPHPTPIHTPIFPQRTTRTPTKKPKPKGPEII